MKIDGTHIVANDGFLLQRSSDKEVVGKEYWLGCRYYALDGSRLVPPVLETAEDFSEVFEEDVRREQEYKERWARLQGEYALLVEKYIRERYSISDEFAIQRQRDTKPEQFKEYFEFCEECKKMAKEELGITD